ncbi:MAG: Hsp20/alpha crystallin family protein [Bacteroidota bacterium]
MALVRFQPFDRDLSTRNFSDLLDDFFNEAVGTQGRGKFMPGMDVSETDDQYQISLEIPGMNKEDINISMEKGLLTISGEREMEKESEGKKYHRVERRYGKFSRSLQLPDNVDADSVKANYKDGILTISVAKSEEEVKKQIEIE